MADAASCIIAEVNMMFMTTILLAVTIVFHAQRVAGSDCSVVYDIPCEGDLVCCPYVNDPYYGSCADAC